MIVLACMSENDNISFIHHSGSIDPRKNLHHSKLHLNVKGSNTLRNNFVRYLKAFPVEKVIHKFTWKSDTIKAL